MSEALKIYCTNTGEYIGITGGETPADIYARCLKDKLGFEPICANINNKAEGLTFPIYTQKQIEFLHPASATGNRVYIRSLCMMLYRAVVGELPGTTLCIEHSVSRGYYCRLFKAGSVLRPDEALVERLKQSVARLAEARLPFVRKEALTKDVIAIFEQQGLKDKVKLLKTTHSLYTVYYELDGIADSYYGPLAPDTGHLRVFDLRVWKEGFLLLGPEPANLDEPRQPVTQEKMFDAFTQYQQFNRIIGVSNVGDLNTAIQKGQAPMLTAVTEAIHDKYISRQSDLIARLNREGDVRIVMMAGPSSSGKTTYSKRLSIQLLTNLLKPKVISLDDYFVDREHTPLDDDGNYDYESLYALNLELLNSQLDDLLHGREVNLPTYSFELGRSIERHRPMRLEKDEVLLIEGIHGLNPELLSRLNPSSVFKVYVSALTTLHIDDHNWIPTTDNRLLRRIVRDSNYRQTSALDTIRRWPSVRRGEEKWIFPYQENADATFNSSLIFELAAMREFALPLLHSVPHDVEEYAEAYRLIKFLNYFEPIPLRQIPRTSLLREFLGGSSFHY